MKTSVNTGEVSSPPTHGARWSVKDRTEHGSGSEKLDFDVKNGLNPPRMGVSSRKGSEKPNLNHEHQLKWEIPVNISSNGKSRIAPPHTMNPSIAATWPTGELGDLVIHAGETSQLFVGTYDYNSITVEAGGVLQVMPPAAAGWTIIGIKGNLILKGKLVAKDFDGLTNGVKTTAPDGTVLVATDIQPQGGTGGGSMANSPGGAIPSGGKPSFNSNGGGGAAMGSNGGDAAMTNGGNGATATTWVGGPEDFGAGGAGASGTSQKGDDGTPAGGGWPPDNIQHAGGGGGGGTHGKRGLPVFLYIGGDFDADGGTIDVSGEPGGDGGKGGDVGNGECGSGGGGGAGGNGGQLVVRFGGTFSPPVYILNGGAGGAGGPPGRSHQWPTQHGQPGQNGQTGWSFSPDIAKIT